MADPTPDVSSDGVAPDADSPQDVARDEMAPGHEPPEVQATKMACPDASSGAGPTGASDEAAAQEVPEAPAEAVRSAPPTSPGDPAPTTPPSKPSTPPNAPNDNAVPDGLAPVPAMNPTDWRYSRSRKHSWTPETNPQKTLRPVFPSHAIFALR